MNATETDRVDSHSGVTRAPANETPRWLDDPHNVNKIVVALYIVCALTIVADFFIHRHGHFWFENLFAFHAVFGFASYVTLIFCAKRLRKLLARSENYYDE